MLEDVFSSDAVDEASITISNPFPAPQKQPISRRFSLDSTKAHHPALKRTKKGAVRRSIDLTVCLHAEVEFSNASARRSSSGSGRRPSISTSLANVSRRTDDSEDVAVKREAIDKTLDLELTPTVELKPFAEADQSVDHREATASAVDRPKAKAKRGRKPAVARQRRERHPRVSSVNGSAHAFIAAAPVVAAPPPPPPQPILAPPPPSDPPVVAYEMTSVTKTESSLFSWSSNSLSPIQDNTSAGPAYSSLPSSISTMTSPTLISQPNPGSAAGSLPHETPTVGAQAPASASFSLSTVFKPIASASLPTISHSPSSMTPSPPPSYFSDDIRVATPVLPPSRDPVSHVSSFQATPSPTAPASVRPRPSTKVPSSILLSPSPVSSSKSSSAPTSPSSSDASGSPPVPSTPQIPHWTDGYGVTRVTDNNNRASVVNNNNVGDTRGSSFEKEQRHLFAEEIGRDKSGTASPAASERDESKNSLELFNVRLADDLIVLRCSVCHKYTVECKSLSDVTILTKVSNHIMEHVDLMS